MLRFLICVSLLLGMLAASLTERAAFAQSDAPEKTKSKSKPASRTKSAKNKKNVDKELAPGVRNYASDNFLVHTDLPEAEALDLLERLETMLKLISAYWDRPNARTIEMYVVKDLNVWPQGLINGDGLDSITSGGGLTVSHTLEQVSRQTGERAVIAAEAVVYAIADRGTPQHEAVHAYCAQTFGRTGPTWYAEGMAEMGNYWRDKDASVNCREEVIAYLKSQEPKKLTEITERGQRTGDSWQNYAWRWALCHLLANNPNYAPRFRPLGLRLLTNQPTSFEEVYGPMAQEITFEYEFFLAHFDVGYRADLCAWDWKAKFNAAKKNSALQAKINANEGWQPARLLAKDGVKYTFETSGTWKLAKDGDDVTPAGNADGKGKLIGILFDDYKLSEPFDLGDTAEWTAPQDGKLFLRCNDGWCDIADNKGTVTIKWKLAE